MNQEINRKMESAKQMLARAGSVLTAYSGGVDSTLLLVLAQEALGPKAAAATLVSPLLPAREKLEAVRFAKERGVRHFLIQAGEMEAPGFVDNTPDRCYLCKRTHLSALLKLAGENGFSRVAHGANADDASDYRPGLRAAAELDIMAPLADAGFSKAEVRAASKALGLSTWDKPAMACLASRIPYGSPITLKKLSMVEQAEDFLHQAGVEQCRVRHHGQTARIEVNPRDFSRLVDIPFRKELVAKFNALGFIYVSLDLAGHQPGGMNKGIAVRA